MNYLVKTHRPGMLYKGPHLFVLNRGRNSGKPLSHSCPNCWVIEAPDEEEITRIRYILYAMHKGRQFEQHLHGSVIEFMRIKQFKDLLRTAVALARINKRFEAIVTAFKTADDLEMTCLLQLDSLKSLRVALGARLIRGE